MEEVVWDAILELLADPEEYYCKTYITSSVCIAGRKGSDSAYTMNTKQIETYNFLMGELWALISTHKYILPKNS